MFGEEQTRTLLKPIDPARHSTIGPPRLSAHDLIVRAEGEGGPVPHHRQRRLTRRLVLTAGTLAAAVAAVAIVPTLGESGQDVSGTGGPAGVVLVPVAYGSDTRDAAGELRALAERIVDAEYDNRVGPYTYHHTKRWGEPVLTSADGRHHVAFAEEVKLWRAADGTTMRSGAALEPQYPDQESRDYWEAGKLPTPDASATAAPSYDVLPREELAPLPSGGPRLDDLLKVEFGTAAVAKAVSTVYGWYVVPREIRAEILRVVADVPGFRWRGEVTDRAGRIGVAVTFDDPEHNQQSLLIFDPETGGLLAYEQVNLSPVQISSYTLFLVTGWTDQAG